MYNILLYHVWISQLYNSLFFGSTVLWTMHWNFWCWEIMVQMCGRTSSEFKWTSLLHHGQSLLSYSYYVMFFVCFCIYGHCIFYLKICVCTCNWLKERCVWLSMCYNDTYKTLVWNLNTNLANAILFLILFPNDINDMQLINYIYSSMYCDWPVFTTICSFSCIQGMRNPV